MKNTMLKILVVGAIVAATAAFGTQVVIKDLPIIPNATGGGGPFEAQFVSDGPSYTPIGSSFITFCLEPAERIILNQPYNFTRDDFIIAATGSSKLPDPTALAQGTVDLYLAYISGGIAPALGPDVQVAIWKLQGYNSYAWPGTIPTSYQNTADYSGDYVYVINPYVGQTPKQSFLGVPDGGMSLILLGMGLASLSAYRRFKKA